MASNKTKNKFQNPALSHGLPRGFGAGVLGDGPTKAADQMSSSLSSSTFSKAISPFDLSSSTFSSSPSTTPSRILISKFSVVNIDSIIYNMTSLNVSQSQTGCIPDIIKCLYICHLVKNCTGARIDRASNTCSLIKNINNSGQKNCFTAVSY
ncbi:hypothetical protein HELRODRAFT_177114 [Helobdella robusta]|uniref:Uncharacterized protein n=1 Tax=Helobdella robusta TaxID=6412 RepID=T1FB88_HELRO|nr:hypothetical protein HELRODRAFT_177114 [Helobdella robusta]ESN98234.1 hypothetical protein HELRODRAFT_177114 [Helobdella robusta]